MSLRATVLSDKGKRWEPTNFSSATSARLLVCSFRGRVVRTCHFSLFDRQRLTFFFLLRAQFPRSCMLPEIKLTWHLFPPPSADTPVRFLNIQARAIHRFLSSRRWDGQVCARNGALMPPPREQSCHRVSPPDPWAYKAGLHSRWFELNFILTTQLRPASLLPIQAQTRIHHTKPSPHLLNTQRFDSSPYLSVHLLLH